MASATTAGATRSAFLELRDEQALIREGYDLLDQERILIAAELLRELSDYRQGLDGYLQAHRRALQALAAASARHGFNELGIHPVTPLKAAALELHGSMFLGVRLDDGKYDAEAANGETEPVLPSPESRACAARFRELIRRSAELGATARNLRRLCDKYIQTERRAKALENVLLPEIDDALNTIGEKLEEVEQEDVIRVRMRLP